MSQPHESPLRRFLPDADPATGPFGVLGVAPDQCEPEAVLAALKRALDRISRHPEARTPDAEEVRLALHVAAAQLMDAGTRAAMIAMWSAPSAQQPTTATSQSSQAASPRPKPTLEAFRLACFEMIAHSGGWNARSRLRVMALADVFGINPDELHLVFQSPPPAAPASPVRLATRAPVVAQASAPQTDKPKRISFTTIALVVLNIVAAVGLVRVIWPSPHESSRATKSPQAREIQPRPVSESAGTIAPITTVPRESREILAVLRQLRDGGAASRDAAASDVLLAIDANLADTWTDLPGRDAILITQTFDESVDRMDASANPALEQLLQQWTNHASPTNAARFRQRAWSIAAAARLAQSNHALTNSKERAQSILRAAGAEPSDEGATDPRASLESAMRSAGVDLTSAMINHEIEPADYEPIWRQWCADAARIARWDPPNYEWILLTYEDLAHLEAGRSTATILDSARTLTLDAVDWRDRPALLRLLHWLSDDEALPAPALATATIAILRQRTDLAAPGELIATDSTVGPNRKALRERWNRALNIGLDEPRQRDRDEWIGLAQRTLEQPESPNSTSQWLTMTVHAARVNTIAHRLWQQDSTSAQSLFRETPWQPEFVKPALEVSPVVLTRPSDEQLAEWSQRFLIAGNDANERVTLLQELRRREQLRSQTDADVLADAAYYDTSIQVRQSAQQVVRVFASDLRVLYALLESLPRTGRTDAESEMIEGVTDRRLPPPRHPDWHDRAASALLNRAFELYARQLSTAPDQAASELSRLYTMQLSDSDSSAVLDEQGAAPDVIAPTEMSLLMAAIPPYAPAERLERDLRREATIVVRSDELLAHDDLQSARRRLATNEIERFAVAQLSCYELMSMIVKGERSSQVARVSALESQTADARRNAATLTEQIARTEAAIIRLWSIRLGLEDRL